MTISLIVGDVRERIKELADESVHCVVTSPPYFGLRDYGMAAQIGLEPTPDAYVSEMVSLFREVRRVLRSDGTFWLNLGDSYASTKVGNTSGTGSSTLGASKGAASHASAMRRGAELSKANIARKSVLPPGVAAKQRFMIPARVALALQADGWWLRDEIIWHKSNPMPTSVKDRTTPSHEMLYMLTKSANYFYDMEAIKEPAVTTNRKKWTDGGSDKQRGHGRTHAGFNGRYAEKLSEGDVPTTRQPRSVWTIAPKPFSGAHFATFPPDLVRPCILAGCPVGGDRTRPVLRCRDHGSSGSRIGTRLHRLRTESRIRTDRTGTAWPCHTTPRPAPFPTPQGTGAAAPP